MEYAARFAHINARSLINVDAQLRRLLERALTEVTNPEQQRQLMQAASRIEVAAVLDKVDSLASVAAKKRNLQNAIDSIHADNVPDELQANELQILEARLRSLG